MNMTPWGLFTTRTKSCEGVSRLIVASKDMMRFKTIKLLLKLSHLLAVCHHVRIMAV
jgi:hypothetical protein